MTEKFKNYNIFVSGAYGHLGSEISKKFCKSGAHVYINGRNPKKLDNLYKLLKKNNGKVTKALFDVTDKNKVKNYFKKVKSLNVVINNATSGLTKKFNDFDDKDYIDAFKVAVVSSANIMKYTEKPLLNGAKKFGTSSVINISSMYGMSRGVLLSTCTRCYLVVGFKFLLKHQL